MTQLSIGDSAPDFSWTTLDGLNMTLEDAAGKYVVLYFYPKDNTPGCTIEAKDFASRHDEFISKNAIIIGVSRDSEASHKKFSSLCDLPFPLISDKSEDVCNAYGVLLQKNMMGRKYMGIDRSTFLISPNKKILNIWRNVSVLGHAGKVLDSIGS